VSLKDEMRQQDAADMRAWASGAWASGKFRKRPVTIEAIHFVGFESSTDPGDWIIRGVKGELYPCKPDIFVMTYEPVV
jgi:hypothetical protein